MFLILTCTPAMKPPTAPNRWLHIRMQILHEQIIVKLMIWMLAFVHRLTSSYHRQIVTVACFPLHYVQLIIKQVATVHTTITCNEIRYSSSFMLLHATTYSSEDTSTLAA